MRISGHVTDSVMGPSIRHHVYQCRVLAESGDYLCKGTEFTEFAAKQELSTESTAVKFDMSLLICDVHMFCVRTAVLLFKIRYDEDTIK